MKRNIPILGALAIVVTGACGWLYAQQPPRPQSTTLPPADSSTLAQVTSTNASSPLTVGAATSTPAVGTPNAAPSMITVDTSSSVTVTVQITDPTLIPGSVNLLLVGVTGTQPTILGVMQNSGNGIYSLQDVFNEPTPGQIQLEVSAAFRGVLRRIVSNIITVQVWQTYHNDRLGVTLSVPPSVIAYQSTDPTIQQVVFVTPPVSSESSILFLVKITPLPQGLSLLQAIQAGGIVSSSIQEVSIASHQWFTWFSPGEASGTWSYASLYSPTQVISILTPSNSFASSTDFSALVASLTLTGQ